MSKLLAWFKSLFSKQVPAAPVSAPVPPPKVEAPAPAPAPTVPPKAPIGDETLWMTWITSHIGQHEKAGKEDNAFIMSLYKYADYPTQHDEVPWCAALANAALKINGYKGTNSAAAASFDKYGTPCEPKYGAIITVRHASGGRHVTFFVRWVDEKNRIAQCLGGNQSNELKISTYNFSGNKAGHDAIIHVAWPVK